MRVKDVIKTNSNLRGEPYIEFAIVNRKGTVVASYTKQKNGPDDLKKTDYGWLNLEIMSWYVFPDPGRPDDLVFWIIVSDEQTSRQNTSKMSVKDLISSNKNNPDIEYVELIICGKDKSVRGSYTPHVTKPGSFADFAKKWTDYEVESWYVCQDPQICDALQFWIYVEEEMKE